MLAAMQARLLIVIALVAAAARRCAVPRRRPRALRGRPALPAGVRRLPPEPVPARAPLRRGVLALRPPALALGCELRLDPRHFRRQPAVAAPRQPAAARGQRHAPLRLPGAPFRRAAGRAARALARVLRRALVSREPGRGVRHRLPDAALDRARDAFLHRRALVRARRTAAPPSA